MVGGFSFKDFMPYKDKKKRQEVKKKWRDKNPSYHKQYFLEWVKKHPTYFKDYFSKNTNPEITVKRLARARVWMAIRHKILQIGSCKIGIDCKGRIEAHHDDYSKPLEIIWFCKKHHEKHHHS